MVSMGIYFGDDIDEDFECKILVSGIEYGMRQVPEGEVMGNQYGLEEEVHVGNKHQERHWRQYLEKNSSQERFH